MASLLHLSDREIRAPETEVLPDGRKRLTRFLSAPNKLEIPKELNFAYGSDDKFTAPTGWTGLRLTNKKLTDDVAPVGKDSRPILQLVYEQIDVAAETPVGADDISYDEAGNKIVVADFVQFTTGVYAPGTIGSTTYSGDATCFLRTVEDNDDGTVRRIKRTFINAGTLSDETQTKNNGALLIRTIRTIKTAPATPSGYTLIGNPTQNPNGLPIFTYMFAKGTGEIDRDTQVKNGGALQMVIIRHLTVPATGSQPTSDPLSGGTITDTQKSEQDGYMLWIVTWAKGTGEISRVSDYRYSTDAGTTGMTVTTIRYLSATSVGSNPITPPGGFATTSDGHEDQDGFRIWTGVYANGTGTVTSSTETRNNGKLVIYNITALNSAPSAPSPTIGGTVVLISSESRKDIRHEGVTVYDYRWAEGKGVIEKSTQPHDAALRFETWVSLGQAFDNAFMQPPGILYKKDHEDIEGVTRWVVTCAQNALGGAITPDGVVTILLTNGGSGYTSAPTVTFSGGGGTGAAATASLIGGAVVSVNLTANGANYTSPPTVTFSGGGGTGATATAVLNPTSVASATLTNGGNGYTSAPTISFSGGNGSGASATATLTPTTVGFVSNIVNNVNYTGTPTVAFTGGGGSGAAGTAAMMSGVCITLTNGGSGYTSAPTVTITGGGGINANFIAKLSGGAVIGFTGGSSGSGYTSLPSLSITGGGGSGATATLSLLGGIPLISVFNQGSGYTSAPTIGFTGGSGTGVAAIAIVSGGHLTDIAITNCGTGYTTTPTVTITGGGGSGATAGAGANFGQISSVTMTNAGSGYTSAPAVSFSGGAGSATAVANLTPTTVASVAMTYGGNGYTGLPSVSFTGGGGSGAAATPVLTSTTVASFQLNEGGSGYTSAPSVSVTGGGGSGATANTTVPSSSAVGSITVTNPGSGYTSAPTIGFTGGSGSGAAATAVVGSISFEKYEEFRYPGRAKLFTTSVVVPTLGTALGLEVFLDPPQHSLVLATHTLTYTTVPTIGTLALPLWNPTNNATMRAIFPGAGGGSRTIIKGLEGYRCDPPGTNSGYATDAGNGITSILGEKLYPSGTGTLVISGGPPDPGGASWTLAAEVDPAFIAFDGTQWYRKLIVTATPPAQTAVPV